MSARGPGSILKGKWSRHHERCSHCGRTDRPHMACGLCRMCYAYHRDPEKEKARRKAKRIKDDTVRKRYKKVRRWHKKNASKVKAYKREWHQQNGPKPKWPVGLTVWAKYAGFWCEGTITDRPNNCTIIVTLKGGTVLRTASRWIRKEKPL